MLAAWPLLLSALAPAHGSLLRELDARQVAAYIVSNASNASDDVVTLAAHIRGANGYPDPPAGTDYDANLTEGEIPQYGVCNGICRATPTDDECEIITKGESGTQEFVNANTKFANWMACMYSCCGQTRKEEGPIVRQITDYERTGGLHEEAIRFTVCEQPGLPFYTCNDKWAEKVVDMTRKMARADENSNSIPKAVTGLGENDKCLGVCERYPGYDDCDQIAKGVEGDLPFINSNAKLAEWLICFADCCALDLNHTTVVNRIADWSKTGISADAERMLREELCMTGIQEQEATCQSGTAQRLEQYIGFMTQGEGGDGLAEYSMIARHDNDVPKSSGLLLHKKATSL